MSAVSHAGTGRTAQRSRDASEPAMEQGASPARPLPARALPKQLCRADCKHPSAHPGVCVGSSCSVPTRSCCIPTRPSRSVPTRPARSVPGPTARTRQERSIRQDWRTARERRSERCRLWVRSLDRVGNGPQDLLSIPRLHDCCPYAYVSGPGSRLLCCYPRTIHMLYFLPTIEPILSSTSSSQRSTTMDPTAPGTSHTKRYRPYFTPAQVHALSAKQRGKLSISRADRTTQQACGFIDAVGCRLGFPRRTIATAQTLYHRFHLFFPLKDFAYHETSLSTLYVSAKLHDTLKKPRDIILGSYALRYPHLVKKGTVDAASVDPKMLERERKRVLSVERLVLETICFSFWAGVRVAFGDVVKFAKTLGAGKQFSQLAWRVSVDSYRTTAPLSYPCHVLALASLYTTALLHLGPPSSDEPEDELSKEALAIVNVLGFPGSWERTYGANAGLIEDVTHYLLDLYHLLISLPPSDPSLSLSPASPASPSASTPKAPSAVINTAYTPRPEWTPLALTELKIQLRERRTSPVLADNVDINDLEDMSDGVGKNEGTIRFLWAEGHAV